MLEPLAPPIRIRDGFPGQRMFVLPRSALGARLRDGRQLGMLPTDVGYFPHAHRHYVERPRGSEQTIMIYCSAGAGWARVGGQKLSVTAGHVLVIGSGLPHAYGATDDRPWTIHWMHLAGPACRALEQLLIDSATPPLVEVGHDPELRHLFDRVFDVLCAADAPGSILRASLLAAGLLERLIDARRRINVKDDLQERIARVIHFMWQRINERVTLDELAEAANLSTSHFAATFKKQTGAPPLDYFLRLQMQQAAHLLDNTALSIKAVAARVGYQDPLYFSRRFRKFYDVSPAQYRSANQRCESPPCCSIIVD